MKKRNRGLTLIEVIVTVAIIAIFTGVVTMLISNGSASYRSTSGNARVQMEAQKTLDGLQNLVIDANRSVYYGKGTADSISLVPNDIDGGGHDDAVVKTLVVCSADAAASGNPDKEDYFWDVITWKAEEQKLFHSSYVKRELPKFEEEVLTPSPAVETMPEKPDLSFSGTSQVSMEGAEQMESQSVFASDIEGFWVDIHEVETNKIIRFQIQTSKNGKTIKTLHTVMLRNKVQISREKEDSAT